MNTKLPFQIRKRQVISLAIFGILIVAAQLAFSFYKKNQHYEKPVITFISETKADLILTEFDPNQLDENQWINLGFLKSRSKLF